ncbi:CHAT domain-containing protein [Merismopedia glauca]|uniref:CHAT domain-containing protein n=1 Tax=Merismopedia glauca CCAP 1448/3 TaxID=1296344 RepID=A0A2T1C0T8_9CYAN|nr:CHAT domain-containing protein [Merismopedia glauca]PSB01852.1 hypothetical protein C7B64_16100 [Merismopedia glauca CCAP 1448/3]
MFSWWEKSRWKFLVGQSHFYSQSGDLVAAISSLEKALAIAEQLGENADLVLTLNGLSQLYVYQNRYAEAENLCSHALDVAEKKLASDSPETALILNNLGGLYELQGKYNEAELLYLRSLAIQEKKWGTNSINIADTITNLGLVYRYQGKYSEAEKLYLRALKIREQNQQADRPVTINLLHNLGRLYLLQGRYQESETTCRRALAIFELQPESDHSSSLLTALLNGLASSYERQGKYEEAEPLYVRAVQISEEKLGFKHQDTARNFNNLADFYSAIGRYQESEEMHLRSLKIREEIWGVNHPNTAMSLNNLASLYRIQGKYGEAELLHSRALKIREEKLGLEHPDTAMSLNNLARVYESQERYGDAERLYQRALNIYEVVLGSDRATTAMTLNNLAQVCQAQNKLQQSESLHLRAMEIRESALGENHPDTIMSMHNLASLYSDQKKYELAEDLFLRLLKVAERRSPPHSNLHSTLNNLALLYKKQGRYAEAEALYKRALQIIPKSLDRNQPEISAILENLAAINIESKNFPSALSLLVESNNLEINHLKKTFFYSNESSRLKQSELKESSLHSLLSYVLTYLPEDIIAIQAAATAVMRWKALATEATATLQNLLYSDRYPHLQAKFKQLQSLRDRAINLLLDPAPNQNAKTLIDSLDEKRQQIEKELSSEVPEIRLMDREFDYLNLVQNLPPESTLIEFFQFYLRDPRTNKYLQTVGIAFLISSQNPEDIKLVNLGDVKPIDSNIKALRRSLQNRGSGLTNLGIGSQRNQAKKASDRELFERVIAPIINIVPPSKKLIIVPSGSLYLIPFETLPIANSPELLIDRYQINYLNSSRDLLRQNTASDYLANPSVIIADPDYDLNSNPPKSVNLFTLLSPASLNSFDRHQETALLGQNIYQKFKDAKIYQGTQASEMTVKSLVSPRVLAIVTHGFALLKSNPEELLKSLTRFYPELPPAEAIAHYREQIDFKFYQYCQDKLAELPSENLEIMGWFQKFLAQIEEPIDLTASVRTDRELLEGWEFGDPSILRSPNRLLQMQEIDNPMLRNGLALAGANLWLKGENLPPYLGKGAILAEDIAQMDLWNTELVVLIACSTAMGEINVREGIFGLRRAFALAGAKTLIMSLWDVPVKVTMLLMDKLFEIYHSKLEISIALQEAQKYIRNLTIEEVEKLEIGRDILTEIQKAETIPSERMIQKSDRPFQHPYYWGAWICQG